MPTVSDQPVSGSSERNNLAVADPNAAPNVALTSLKPRQCAVISDILAADDDTDRLKAMGVCSGRRVEVIKNGDPLILRVLGSRIGISARLAKRVMVDARALPGSQAT